MYCNRLNFSSTWICPCAVAAENRTPKHRKTRV